MSWQAVKLSDVCLTITDGAHKSPPSQESGFPMASVKDMTHWGINLENCRLINQQDFDELCSSGCQPIKGDVLIAKDGNSCLQTVCVHGATIDMVLLSSVAILRPNPEKCDSKFLQYHLTNPYTKAALKNYISGVAIPRVVLRDFKNYQFSIPSIDVQQKIGSVLSEYDDLIENNRRRIQLLEESARLLYKEWFVHLRFPSHEHVKITDGVPEGWSKKPIKEILTLNYGKALKADLRFPGDYPVYGSSGAVGSHNKSLVKAPGIIVGRKGNVGSIYWVNRDYWPIDTVYFVSREESNLYLYHALQNVSFINTDVAVPGLNRDMAYSREVLLPADKILNLFLEEVEPIQLQIEQLSEYNKKLSEARDILLPRLMNGELTV